MAFMYILKCANGSYYTGSTRNLGRRLYQHRSGAGANHTRKYAPVELVYYEEYTLIKDAFYREKQVQRWSHKKKKALIAKNYADLHNFSKCQNKSYYKNRYDLASTTPRLRSVYALGEHKHGYRARSR
jgi:putative endonuclease